MYCLSSSVFWCFLAAGLTAWVFAIIELLLRFKPGNEIKIILFGTPQYWYYFINVAFACGALFASEALATSSLFKLIESNLPEAIVRSAGLALAALVASRASIGAGAKGSHPDGSNGWGPGVLVGKLLAIIDEKIEQLRAIATAPALNTLAEKCLPIYIYSFVLPYCFAQSERLAGPAEIDITKKLQEIELKSETTTPFQKSLLMLTLLQKEFGSECLQAAIRLLGQTGTAPPAADLKVQTYIEQSDKLEQLYIKATAF